MSLSHLHALRTSCVDDLVWCRKTIMLPDLHRDRIASLKAWEDSLLRRLTSIDKKIELRTPRFIGAQ